MQITNVESPTACTNTAQPCSPSCRGCSISTLWMPTPSRW